MAAGKKTRAEVRPLAADKAAKAARRAKAGEYKFAVNAWKKSEAKRTGKKPSEIKVRGNSDDAKRFQSHWKKIKESPSPGKTFREFLEELDLPQSQGQKYANIVDTFFITDLAS